MWAEKSVDVAHATPYTSSCRLARAFLVGGSSNSFVVQLRNSSSVLIVPSNFWPAYPSRSATVCGVVYVCHLHVPASDGVTSVGIHIRCLPISHNPG